VRRLGWPNLHWLSVPWCCNSDSSQTLKIVQPNQVWAIDITYIPMARGFVYLVAVVDWFSRRVLSWRLSITMDVDFCLEAVEEALACYGRPEIFNSDQGSQFTSAAFTGLLLANTIAVSMDGRGAWRDNVFVERLWRSVKYEEVYLRAYDSVGEARASLSRYFTFYNTKRPHPLSGPKRCLDEAGHRLTSFRRSPDIGALSR
jgi:putative transposase